MTKKIPTESFPSIHIFADDFFESSNFEEVRNWVSDYQGNRLSILLEIVYSYPNSSTPEKPYRHEEFQAAIFSDKSSLQDYAKLLTPEEQVGFFERNTLIRTIEGPGPDRTVTEKLCDYS